MDRIIYVVEASGITSKEFAKLAKIPEKKFCEQIYGLRNLQPNVLRAILEATKEDGNKIYFHPKYPNICLDGLTLEQVLKIMEIIHPEFFNRKRLKPRKHDLSDLEYDMGHRIRFIREAIIALSQKKLGDLIGVTRDSSKYWDTGDLNVKKVIQLSKMTNISINYIVLNQYPLELHTLGMSEDEYLAILSLRNVYRKRNIQVSK